MKSLGIFCSRCIGWHWSLWQFPRRRRRRGHIMKLLSLTFGKKFRTACIDVANIFQWQMLKLTSKIDSFCPVMRSFTFFFIIKLVLCDEVLKLLSCQSIYKSLVGRELKGGDWNSKSLIVQSSLFLLSTPGLQTHKTNIVRLIAN